MINKINLKLRTETPKDSERLGDKHELRVVKYRLAKLHTSQRKIMVLYL